MIQQEVMRSTTHKKTQWSGGETTELLIYPREAQYEQRQFAYRVSTATITVSVSTFTPLPAYQRILMVLDNQVKLLHESNGEKRAVFLSPFEQDSFCGAEQTTSYGQCTDFNLMYASGYTGKLSFVKSGERCILKAKEDYFYYCLSNEITIHVMKNNNMIQRISLQQGDSILFAQVDAAISIEFSDNVHNSPQIIAVVANIAMQKRG